MPRPILPAAALAALAATTAAAAGADLVANCNVRYEFGGETRNGPVLVQANEQLARMEGLWPEEFSVTRFDPLAVEFTTTRGDMLFIGRIDRATARVSLEYIDQAAARREVTSIASGACKRAEPQL